PETAPKERASGVVKTHVGKQGAAGPSFDGMSYLASVGAGRTGAVFEPKQMIYRQGDVADAVYYIESGKVQLTVVSEHGKEGVIAMLGAGEFFGEGCLAGQSLRMASA